MATMKAVRIHEYGGSEVLKYENAPRPEPGKREVLVRIHAAGVNPVDWKVRAGLAKSFKHKLPLILGWDVSGVIDVTGAEVSGLNIGDEVFSRPDMTRNGAYAEYIVIRESEVALKPKSIDYIHAGTIPLATLTAWQTLFDTAGLKSEQKVLIHGASGGVGSFAVQLAKWTGAYVIGTASSANQGFLRELGVDEVIDYTKVRFEEAVHDVDVVLDTIGGDTQKRSWKVLKQGGILVSILSAPSEEEAKAHKARAGYVFVQPNAQQLTRIAELVDAGKIRAMVQTVLPLSDARKAHELIQTGHTRGKIVLRVL